MTGIPEKWELETDVLVIGSGAGGSRQPYPPMTMGPELLLIEKTDLFGGTTAMGGGGMWIPNNHHNVEKGVSDSREKALGYAKLLTKGRAADELIEAYVDTAPEMLKYMEEKVGLRVQVSTMPDYHPEQPGGHDGENSRTVIPDLFDTTTLGEHQLLRPNPHQPYPHEKQ